MKATPIVVLAALALSACDKAAAERSRDNDLAARPESDAVRASAEQAAAPTAAVTASAAPKPSPSGDDEADSPEIADASGAPPSPTVAADALKDVQIPAGVTIPTEEDYEEKAEKEITAANLEAELAKIEKELAPAAR